MSGNNPDTLKAYYLAHKEEIIAYGRTWAAANKERIAAKKRAYALAHKEEIAAKNRAYYEAHKAELLPKQHRYNAQHRKESNARHRAYAVTHPEYYVSSRIRRRARKQNAPINDLTDAQWREIKEHYGHRCVYCGRKMQRLTPDHLTPYAKQGSNTLWNVVPACYSCNSSKQAGPPPVPVQPLLLTIAPAKKEKAS